MWWDSSTAQRLGLLARLVHDSPCVFCGAGSSKVARRFQQRIGVALLQSLPAPLLVVCSLGTRLLSIKCCLACEFFS